MRIVIISDTHNRHNDISLPDGDVLIHCGDSTLSGKDHEVHSFLNWFQDQKKYRYRLLIAGNHDFFFEQNPVYVRGLTSSMKLTYLLDDAVELDGIKFYGSPWQPRFFDWAFNLDRGEPLRKKWEDIPSDTNVLITHGPPKSILDRTQDGSMVGCLDLLERIREVRPSIHAFGHIHESYGIRSSGGTVFVNASVCNLSYNPVNPPIVIDLDNFGGVKLINA